MSLALKNSGSDFKICEFHVNGYLRIADCYFDGCRLQFLTDDHNFFGDIM